MHIFFRFRERLLHSIYCSRSAQRETGRMTILMFGATGVGKSCTRNFLFNLDSNNTCTLSNVESYTREVSELVIYSPDEAFETCDIKVGMIDSPGLCDTEGLTQDACNAYAIRRFYENVASQNDVKKVYPNLIFITIRSTDWRISGTTSQLVRSLKVLKRLGLVDVKKPNVLGVITHANSFSRDKKKWLDLFKEKKKCFSEVIFRYLDVKPEIVVVENFPEDEKLVKEEGGYGYILPDGTQQPRNLFSACSKLLSENGDSFGHLAFTAAFRESIVRSEPSRCFSVKKASTELLNEDEKELLEFMKEDVMGNTCDAKLKSLQSIFPFEQADLSDAEKKTLDKIASDLKRNGIKNTEELQQLTLIEIRQITDVEITVAVEAKLLQSGLKPAKNEKQLNFDDSVSLIGHGFNILLDRCTTPSIFKYELRDTKLSIVVPKEARFNKVNQTVTFMQNFENESQLMKYRQIHLGVCLEVDHALLEGFNARAGFNLSKKSGKSNSNSDYSFLLEQRTFEVTFPDLRVMQLTDEFQAAATDLPSTFDAAEPRVRQSYKMFFEKWGQFVVVKAFGGGSVELKITSSSSTAVDFEYIKAKLLTSFNAAFIAPVGKAGAESSSGRETETILGNCRIEWNGGDSKFHNHDTMTKPGELNKWRLSLASDPAMLTTDLSLTPISDLVARVDKGKGRECYKALENLLGGKFQLRKKEEERREQETTVTSSRAEEVALERQRARYNRHSTAIDALVKSPSCTLL